MIVVCHQRNHPNLTYGKSYTVLDITKYPLYNHLGHLRSYLIINDINIITYYMPDIFTPMDIWRNKKIDQILKDD